MPIRKGNPSENYPLRILSALRQIMQAVDIYSRQLASRHHITAPQLICLLYVAKDGPLTLTALSKMVHLSSSTLIGVLDRLEAKHLIQRQRDREDRRQILISATEQGRKLASKSPSPLQESLAAGIASLPRSEQAAIADSLERVVSLMAAGEIEAAPML